MPLHTILFASSLFLIALFFGIKEREVYAGQSTAFTKFLARHSPIAEDFWNRCLAFVGRVVRSVSSHVVDFCTNLGARGTVAFRYVVVVLADKMIKAVRGEKFLEMRGAPSMYLKHLREHRDANGRPADESK